MIYILLPTYNRKEITRSFLDSLSIQTYKNYTIINIDDSSIDGTSELIKSYFPSSIILKGNGNLWWAGALQMGVKWLKKNNVDIANYILIINDDSTFDQNFLKMGLSIIEKKEKSLLLAKSISKENGMILDQGLKIDWKNFRFNYDIKKNETNCFSTRGLLLKIEDLFSIGSFHPKMLPHYGSDYEFTHRAFKKYFNLITDDNYYLYPNTESSGFHKINFVTWTKYFKHYFSKKNPNNILYLTSFILYACPFYLIPKNLFLCYIRQIKVFLSKVIQSLNKNLNIKKV
jgi:GT2 family glycosyltransferase